MATIRNGSNKTLKSATKTTTTKTSTTKTATPKKVVSKKVEEKDNATISAKDVTDAVVAGVTAAMKKDEPKETRYKEHDMILCRSVTYGELIITGNGFDNKYIFSGYGDTCEMSVSDLNSLRATRSAFMFDPMFVIEDEDFLNQPQWKTVKKMYDNMAYDNVDEILGLSNNDFEETLKHLPDGFIKSIQSAISTGILNNTFDSLQKVRIFDEVCNTDLMCLLR